MMDEFYDKKLKELEEEIKELHEENLEYSNKIDYLERCINEITNNKDVGCLWIIVVVIIMILIAKGC